VTPEESKDQRDRGWELVLALLATHGLHGVTDLNLVSEPMRLQMLDELIEETSAGLVSATSDLIEHRTSLRAWLLRFRDILIPALAAATMLLIKRNYIESELLEAWVSETNLQNGYLYRFFSEIRDGDQVLNTSAIGRTDLYARAIWAVAWRVYVSSLVSQENKGDPWCGLSVLGVADHCKGCLSEAAKGWQLLKDVKPIGSRDCGSRCACTLKTMTFSQIGGRLGTRGELDSGGQGDPG
jgi:hypothetical protein